MAVSLSFLRVGPQPLTRRWADFVCMGVDRGRDGADQIIPTQRWLLLTSSPLWPSESSLFLTCTRIAESHLLLERATPGFMQMSRSRHRNVDLVEIA
jgi:hypothetical protein